MSQARDLLSLLLATAPPPQIPGISQAPAQPKQPSTLNASVVSKPSPIQSVQAFNTQLVVGGKDLALRKAADLLKAAASSVEKSRGLSERYWFDALKIRRGNWGLIPAPLPFGTATGRGADKTSKDFLVSFSLEECEFCECSYGHSADVRSSTYRVPETRHRSHTNIRQQAGHPGISSEAIHTLASLHHPHCGRLASSNKKHPAALR